MSKIKNQHAESQVLKDSALNFDDTSQQSDGLLRFAPIEPKPERGFFYNWGLDAIVNLLVGKYVMKTIFFMVPHTLIPMIKLCVDNRKEVDREYEKLKEHNEITRFFDSPRERWRKKYGNYIREIEWACHHLRQYFTKRAYEDLVINVTADYMKSRMSAVVPFFNMLMGIKKERKEKKKEYSKFSDLVNKFASWFVGKIFSDGINLVGFLVGDIEVKELDMRQGYMEMKVVDCLWLRSPRMKDYPEEGCLLFCKGGCEKAFEIDAPFRITLDPLLPESTCDIKISWNEEEGAM